MWPLGTAFAFGAIIEFPHPPRPRPKRGRDLGGLPRVLGRFGNLEIRLAATKKDVRRAQRLRFKVFYEEGGAVAQGGSALVRRDICRFDKFCDRIHQTVGGVHRFVFQERLKVAVEPWGFEIPIDSQHAVAVGS